MSHPMRLLMALLCGMWLASHLPKAPGVISVPDPDAAAAPTPNGARAPVTSP